MSLAIELGISPSMPSWRRRRLSKDMGAAVKMVSNRLGEGGVVKSPSLNRSRFEGSLNGLYGLDPLCHFATQLALGVRSRGDRSFIECLVDYDDALEENPHMPFQQLILAGGSGCFFFPVRSREVLFPEGKPFVVGSSLELGQEVQALHGELESGLGVASSFDDATRKKLTTICEALLDIVRKSITRSLPMVLYWEFESWDGNQKIDDYSASPLGFMEFSGSSVKERGNLLRVSFRSGATYSIPCGYVATWFESFDAEEILAQSSEDLIVRSRVISRGTEVRVYLGDGTHWDIPWDTVLMACEPKYEHFGGFTSTSRRLTECWRDKVGSFRVAP